MPNKKWVYIWLINSFFSIAQAANVPRSNWGLNEINAREAWRLSKGTRNVVVAVIDTGIDIQHPDLKDSLWVNPGESGQDSNGQDKSINSIDDDSNGFVDDIHGWNFVENSNSLTDHHGHGTHVSGIIAAHGDGISGVAPGVRLMVLKYHDPKFMGRDAVSATIKSIQYAIKMKADIINYSSGGLLGSTEEEAAIREAQKNKILFVAAAGNESSNSDRIGYFPASYGLSNIISVTAIDTNRKLIDVANFGANSVQIAAPGKDILSTMPGGGYGFMTGTSQATAFVSAVAAMMLACDLELRDPEQVIKRLSQTADFDENLVGKTKFQARLNAYHALALQPQDKNAFGSRTVNTAFVDTHIFSSDLNLESFDPAKIIKNIPR